MSLSMPARADVPQEAYDRRTEIREILDVAAVQREAAAGCADAGFDPEEALDLVVSVSELAQALFEEADRPLRVGFRPAERRGRPGLEFAFRAQGTSEEEAADLHRRMGSVALTGHAFSQGLLDELRMRPRCGVEVSLVGFRRLR